MEQQLADWLDHETGEVLSGYVPSEEMKKLTESGSED